MHYSFSLRRFGGYCNTVAYFLNMSNLIVLNHQCLPCKFLKIADNMYISQVYFHTLFLYAVLKQRDYKFIPSVENQPEKTLEDVLRDLFKSSYGEFLLKFGGAEELISVLD